MIVVENVSKRFGKVVALDGVSLTIEPGARVALVGTNGSGKTTLLRALAGLLRVEGRILVDGVDVARSPERALENLAYVPQIAPPLEAPVVEVVRAHATIRAIAPSAVEACARRLGLELPAIAKVRFRDLSGGMKQKLLAALAMATDANVLVCDEPTANLDPTARAAFFEEVARRRADSILVVCSHRVDEVKGLVDRVVDMRDGRIFRTLEVARTAAPASVPEAAPDSAPRDDAAWNLEPALAARSAS